MPVFSWRNFVLAFVTTLSLLAGCPNKVQACCLSWLCSCLGGGYSSGWYGAGYPGAYYGGYGSGYYSGYLGGYYGDFAPSYGGCSSCGVGTSGVTSSGCSTCTSNCEVTSPNPTKGPVPDPPPTDPFKAGGNPNDSKNLPPKNNYDRPGRGGTSKDNTNIGPRDDSDSEGFKDRRRSDPADRSNDDTRFERPLRSNDGDKFLDNDTRKTPLPEEENAESLEKEPEDADAFPVDSPDFKANRPDLGTPSETAPGTEGKSIIHEATPAPSPEAPNEPEPADAEELKLDDSSASSAVFSKTRLGLKGRFGSPSLVRTQVRPNTQWVATPNGPQLAKH